MVEVRIADISDHEVPRGTVGEVQVRGPNIMLGYWNKPDLSFEALRGGWYHTGDGGYMDEEGFVYIVDRLKDMIITGGENVYSAEVENAILLHDAVAEVAVIGIPDDTWGEAVHAIVVPRAGRTLTPDEIIAHCRDLIAGYKCPHSVVVRSEPMPLSGAGKILSRARCARLIGKGASGPFRRTFNRTRSLRRGPRVRTCACSVSALNCRSELSAFKGSFAG